MPIYDYLCKACGHRLEVFQKASENPLRKCPECGKLKLEQQMGAPAFRIQAGTPMNHTSRKRPK